MNNRKFITSLIALLLFSFVLNGKPAYHDHFYQQISDTTKNQKKSEKLDTSKITSSSQSKTVKAEKILPIQIEQKLSNPQKGKMISIDELNSLDYRNTGNYFSYFPFGFLRDAGSHGHPSELLIYGIGNGNISVMHNGIGINNRFTNSYDINLFQTESIDTIEVVPLAQGFLFNPQNFPVSINFIQRNFYSSKPYTRIKFYQAPNEEGSFDGIFSTNLTNKLSIYSEISHQSTDSRYRNSEFSYWSGITRLRYLLNKNLNIIGSYNYTQTNVGLNGGVDADSIKRSNLPSQFDELLYSTIQAPVNFEDRYQKVSQHSFDMRLLVNLINNNPTDIVLYYRTSLTEFRQNENTTPLDSSDRYRRIIHNNKFNATGIKLSQNADLAFLKLNSIFQYENFSLRSPLLTNEKEISLFSVAASANLNSLDSTSFFNPSVFGKFLNYNSENYFGFGADFSLKLSKHFSIYSGISKFQKPVDEIRKAYYELSDKSNLENTVLEAKLNYHSNSLNFSGGYFLNKFSGNQLIANTQLNGLNFNADLKIWRLLFTSNTSFYFDKKGRDDFNIPDITSTGGIYFIDTLFNSNLELKTGINYYFVGSRGNVFVDYERDLILGSIYNSQTKSLVSLAELEIKPSIQVDFFLAGKIQKNATLYIVFENLFNEKYFIMPYYPKQERGLRFGVAWEFFD